MHGVSQGLQALDQMAREVVFVVSVEVVSSQVRVASCVRLGPGGACPHCDEAVAVADLIADVRASIGTPRLLLSDTEVSTQSRTNRQ